MNDSGMGHYVCSWCNISFVEISILHLHMGVHIELVGPKGTTSSEIPESNILSEVKEDSDDKGEYHCKVCQKYFNNQGIFRLHMRAHREGKTFQCKICGSVFAMKSGVYNHVCKHISENLCKCTGGHVALQGMEDQPRIFESADDLNKCGVCDGGYSTKKRLDRHALKHMGHFSCSICKRSYQGQAEYDKHMECHAYVMFFRCDMCFETFYDKEKRDDHMKTHSSLSPLKDGKFANDHSDISDKIVSKKLKSGCLPVNAISAGPNAIGPSFSKNLLPSKKRSNLRSILKDIGVSRGTAVGGSNKEKLSPRGNLINTGEIISEDLTIPGSQNDYLAQVEKGRNTFRLKSSACEESGKYECKLCYKMWEEKRAFWQHLLRHSEDVPHTCKICVEIFEDVKSWKNHTEQKCGCALCGKLIQRIDYVIHSKVCPVNNPFKCLVCFKRFSSSDLFRDHMTSHSKEKACRCKVCGEVLLLKYEAERHNRMHKKQSVDPVSTVLPSEDEEDLLSVSPSAKTLSCKVESEESLQFPYVSVDERDLKVPLSSIGIENNIASHSLNTVSAITVKDEPLSEDKNIFSDTVFETNVGQSYVVMVTDEVNAFHHDESVVDPLA
ncbi:zinc finger protein 699-like [Palaemon carinicauda]|uniref:zinc finger protein 699-like n=1 Tax=Palaemon carinicauda TaxID=392227 RepID=UPI0035B57D74